MSLAKINFKEDTTMEAVENKFILSDLIIKGYNGNTFTLGYNNNERKDPFNPDDPTDQPNDPQNPPFGDDNGRDKPQPPIGDKPHTMSNVYYV
jgi:hypothetical protein